MSDGTQVDSLFLSIKSDSKSASDGIDTLIATLEKLKKTTNGGLGLPSVSTNLNNLGTSADKTSKKLKNIGSATDGMSKGFINLYAKLKTVEASVLRIGQSIFRFINQSNSYIENINLFNVSMGKYADEAMRYAETVNEVIGIDPGEWARNQGVFMTLAKGFGVIEDRAFTMSQNLTQLGYDLSSFYNISFEDSMQKLQSGLAGELEPLRRLGYDLSKARLEAIALSLGIDKTFNSMTQAEKAQLRYYAIMTQVTEVQGDMARTLEAPANQLRILSSQLNQLGREIGNIFIPLLNKVLPYAIAAVKVLKEIAHIIADLVGFEMPEIDYSSVNSGGVKNLTDDLDDATEAAEKLQKATIGIDKLNIISENKKDKDNGSDLGSMFDFELPTYDFLGDAVQTKVNEITEKMKEWLGITGEIDSWSDLFGTKLGEIATTIGTIVAVIATLKIGGEILSIIAQLPQIASVLGSVSSALGGVGTAIGAISAPVLVVVGVIAALAAGLAYVYATHEEIRESVAAALDNLKNSFTPLIEFITNKVLPDLINAWNGLMEILRPLGEWLDGFFSDIWNGIIIPAINYLAEEVIPGATKVLEDLWNEVLVPLGEFIGDVLGPVIEYLALTFDYLWKDILEPIIQVIGKTLAKAWEGLVEILDKTVIPTIGLVIAGFDWLWLNVLEPIARWLVELFKPMWDEVFKAIKSMIEDIGTILGGVIDFIAGVLSGDWAKAWAGLCNIVLGALNLIVSFAEGIVNGFIKYGEGIINGFIDILNFAISGINSVLSAKLPDWLGGGSIGFTIPTINHVTLGTVEFGKFEEVKPEDINRLLKPGSSSPSTTAGRTVGGGSFGAAQYAATVKDNEFDGSLSSILALLQQQNDLTRQLRDKDNGVYLDGKQLAGAVEKRQNETGAKIYGGGGGGVMYVN